MGNRHPPSFFPSALYINAVKRVFYSLLNKELEKQQVGSVIVLVLAK